MSRESIYKRYIPGITFEERNTECCYWFVFSPPKLLLKAERDTLNIPLIKNLKELGLSPIRRQYLGTLQGYPCFSAEVSPDTIAPEGLSFRELRSVYGFLDEDIFLLAGRALQIVRWDQTHQFCGRCGSRTETLQGERAKKCPACGFISYPRLSPAVIVAVLKDNKILLAHYAAFRGNMRTIIAGFVEPGETLEECLKREIQEEVGLRVKNVKYFSSQPWPFPNSLMIGFTAEYESGEISVDGREISQADWYDVHKLPEVPPEISIAREIIEWCVQNISHKI
jgi:NAD+ diphosphatase